MSGHLHQKDQIVISLREDQCLGSQIMRQISDINPEGLGEFPTCFWTLLPAGAKPEFGLEAIL